LVLVKPDLPSPLADLKSSTANEIAPGGEYLWQHTKVRVPENPGLHYVIFAVSYRDPLAATRSAQLLVLQWPGATQGRVPIGLNHAQADEADHVVKQAEAAIGPLR